MTTPARVRQITSHRLCWLGISQSVCCGRTADGGLKIASAYGLNGFTANWMTRYGVPPRGPVFHWLMNTRSSSSVDPGEM